MKKYGFRFIVGLITFTIGLSFVWSNWTKNVKFCELVTKENQLTESQQNKFSTSENGKIEIRFIGYGKIENQPTIKFEVINHNLKSAKYSAYANNTLTFLSVKFNGKEDERYHCGTGLKEFELNSGESFETEEVLDYLVYDFLDINGKFEFGHYFRLSNDKEAKTYWSESIIISDRMKKEILESSSRFSK
jgi:hypothetical protein